MGADTTHSIASPPGDDTIFGGSSKVDDAGHIGNSWSIDDLRPLGETLSQLASFSRSQWAPDETKTFTSFDIAKMLAELPDIREEETTRAGEARRIILSRYKVVLQTLFRQSLITNHFAKVEDEEDEIPVAFARVKNQSCLLVTHIRLTDVINIEKFSSKERVRRVVKQELVPGVLSFKRYLDDLNFDLYGLVISFRTGDIHGSRLDLLFGAEMVCLVVASDDLEAFIELDISEEELLRRSQVFSSDRDMGRSDIKRIELDE